MSSADIELWLNSQRCSNVEFCPINMSPNVSYHHHMVTSVYGHLCVHSCSFGQFLISRRFSQFQFFFCQSRRDFPTHLQLHTLSRFTPYHHPHTPSLSPRSSSWHLPSTHPPPPKSSCTRTAMYSNTKRREWQLGRDLTVSADRAHTHMCAAAEERNLNGSLNVSIPYSIKHSNQPVIYFYHFGSIVIDRFS